MGKTSSLLFWARFLFLLYVPETYCGTPASVLDLSYKHYIEVDDLGDAIQSELWDLEIGQRPEDIEVDISYSVLGDMEGIKGIFQKLLPQKLDDNRFDLAPVRISLLTRGNRITPEIMDTLFSQLLNENNGGEQKKAKDEQEVGKNDKSLDNPEVQEKSKSTSRIPWSVNTIDVGWNLLHPDATGWKKFVKSLEKLIASRESCPHVIRLDRCGLGPGACRAIGKGIISRFVGPNNKENAPMKEVSIYLCGNTDLGDSGCAAIAAAIRTIVTDDKCNRGAAVIFDTLDLSACGVGDTGAEALALALESCPGLSIRHLDLSNNKITDAGATLLGHALSSGADRNEKTIIDSLDLSGNKDIGDKAAIAIASVVGKGQLKTIILRSCQVLADGAAAFGKALGELSRRDSVPHTVQIDLSGNPLGVLRGKSDKNKKYSASAIKSKASATAAAYMNMIQKGVRSGLKSYGVEMGSTMESDDEEEALEGMGNELVNDGDLDPKKARCGIKAFANAILDDADKERNDDMVSTKQTVPIKCKLAMRHCFLDHGAADALAAVLVRATNEMGIDLALDVGLNPVLEDEMTQALEGNKAYDAMLQDMAERHMDALEALRDARERAAEAAQNAAARVQAEADYESQWDAPDFGFNYGEDEWDSDADYDKDDEYDY